MISSSSSSSSSMIKGEPRGQAAALPGPRQQQEHQDLTSGTALDFAERPRLLFTLPLSLPDSVGI